MDIDVFPEVGQTWKHAADDRKVKIIAIRAEQRDQVCIVTVVAIDTENAPSTDHPLHDFLRAYAIAGEVL
jgi:hypothetical protein